MKSVIMKDEQRRYNKPWIALAFLCLAVMIIGVDDGVLNLALPAISEEFEANISELQWMINAYLLSFGALLLTMGALGDRFGRKRLFQAGLIVFGVFSLVAAFSTSMGMLIACRALMGIGGAMALPQTLSIIRAVFADPKQRATAIGIWAGIFGFGYGIGPVIGGILLEYFEWYSVFLFNIPIVLIALAGGYYFVRESRDETAPRVDLPGVLLSIAGLSLLVYGIIKAGADEWTEASAIAFMVVGIAVLAVFVWWERRTDHPMFPMRFFRNMSFTGANVAMVAGSFGTAGMLFFLSQYWQTVQGHSALGAALRLLPGTVLMTMVAIMVPIAVRAIGVKLPVSLGIFVSGCGLFWLSFATTDTSYLVLLGPLILVGIGFGLAWSPAADSVMGSLPVDKAGIGSAMDATTQQIGYLLGVAVLGAVMNRIYLDSTESLRAVTSLTEETYGAIQNSIQSAHIVAEQLPPDVSALIVEETNKAFTSGMSDAMLIGAIVMVLASLVTLIILPTRIRPPQE